MGVSVGVRVVDVSADGEVGAQGDEEREGEDLEGEAGHHDVVAGGGGFVGVTCS